MVFVEDVSFVDSTTLNRRAVKITNAEREAIAAAVGSTKAIFQKGRISRLVTGDLLNRYARRRVDKHLHDGIKEASRAGYAVASSDMNVLAHGLHSARYAKLAANGIPKSKTELSGFLMDLILKRQTADQKSPAYCLTLIVDGLERENVNDYSLSIDRLTTNLWILKDYSESLYVSIVSGSVTTASEIIDTISDFTIRDIAVKTMVRCTQIWGGFDLQRSASCRRASRKSVIPVFMQPFMTTDTTAEYIGVMQHTVDTMRRIFEAAELAQRYGKTVVRLRGPEGPLIDAVRPPAQDLELDTATIVLAKEPQSFRGKMLAKADAIVESCRKDLLPGAGGQQTLHQHRFAGLTELAAFAVTAVRFVQAERQLTEFLNDPEKGLNLGGLLNRPVSNNLEAGVIGRARELVAAYRTAIILDAHAPLAGEASDTSADDAFKLARAFLAKFDDGTASPNDSKRPARHALR